MFANAPIITDNAAAPMPAEIVKCPDLALSVTQDQGAFWTNVKGYVRACLWQVTDMTSQLPMALKQQISFQRKQLFIAVAPSRKAGAVPIIGNVSLLVRHITSFTVNG